MKDGKKLAAHVIAMQNDDYLIGHPEWAEIVQDALDCFGGFKRCPHLYPVDGKDNTFCPKCSADNEGIPHFDLESTVTESARMLAAEALAVLDTCPHIDTEAECDCGSECPGCGGNRVIVGVSGELLRCPSCEEASIECERCMDTGYVTRDDPAGETCPDCAIAAECTLITYYVGMCKWDGGDIIFVSRSKDVTPPDVYDKWGWSGHEAAPRSIEAFGAVEAGEAYLMEAFGLKVDEISHLMRARILEFNSDGWGLFTWVSNPPDFEGWRLTDHFDRIAQMESDSADQAYHNDLRFGADSDDSAWYGEDHEDPRWHAHPDDCEV